MEWLDQSILIFAEGTPQDSSTVLSTCGEGSWRMRYVDLNVV